MPTSCPHCDDYNVKRTVPGAVLDAYRCQKCGGGFEKISPTAKRFAIVGVVTVLTGGLDAGAFGTFAASLFGDS